MGSAQSSSFKHICKRGFCISSAPSHYWHFRQKELKCRPPGDQNRVHRASSSLVNSMRSHHGHSDWFPQAKKPLNCSWLTMKSYFKKTPSGILALFFHPEIVWCLYAYWIAKESSMNYNDILRVVQLKGNNEKETKNLMHLIICSLLAMLTAL